MSHIFSWELVVLVPTFVAKSKTDKTLKFHIFRGGGDFLPNIWVEGETTMGGRGGSKFVVEKSPISDPNFCSYSCYSYYLSIEIKKVNVQSAYNTCSIIRCSSHLFKSIRNQTQSTSTEAKKNT